jgi:hypothetical protein
MPEDGDLTEDQRRELDRLIAAAKRQRPGDPKDPDQLRRLADRQFDVDVSQLESIEEYLERLMRRVPDMTQAELRDLLAKLRMVQAFGERVEREVWGPEGA